MKNKAKRIKKSEEKNTKNHETANLKSVMDEFYYSHLLGLLFDHEGMNGESNCNIKNGNNKNKLTNKNNKWSIK